MQNTPSLSTLQYLLWPGVVTLDRVSNENNDLPRNPSEKTFLRVRVRFVERRDVFMQILVCLDRDKNSSVGVAHAFVASEKRLTLGLCFLFVCLSRRLPIELAREGRITDLFYFLIWWPIGLASERDRETLLVHPKSPLVARRKRALKKIFFCFRVLSMGQIKLFDM